MKIVIMYVYNINCYIEVATVGVHIPIRTFKVTI